MNNSPLLLIVDDETTILKTLKEALEDEKYQVETIQDGNKALDAIGKLIPDLVLLDIFMPNCSGLELLEKIKKEYPQQRVIIISGFGNIPIAIQAVKNGALDFIEKPLNLDEILSKISFLKEKHVDSKIKNDSPENLEDFGIIGQSNLFLELIQQLNMVKKLTLPLLIYGQHGTGKALFAKYIHGSVLHGLCILNSESLTREESIKIINNFFTNQEGTLFVKNINQLDLDSQKRLLFYLQNDTTKNTRVIASCCTPLYELVKEGKFNNSLFHALNSTPLEIPPLNKRRYDIPLLVDYYLKKYNLRYNKSIILNIKSVRNLRNHSWQANVSELKTVIKKIVINTDQENQVINPEILNLYLDEKRTHIIEEQFFTKFNSLKEASQDFEKNFLTFLLKKNHFDIKQVSNRLNLTPIQLRDKILKLDLEIKI